MVRESKRDARVPRASLSSLWAAHWRAWIFVGGFLCGSIGARSTQEVPTQPVPHSDPKMEEALRAMVRGLKDRTRELGNPEEEPSKTGSIAQGPSAPAMADDFRRLFEPRPLGPPTTLARPRPPERRPTETLGARHSVKPPGLRKGETADIVDNEILKSCSGAPERDYVPHEAGRRGVLFQWRAACLVFARNAANLEALAGACAMAQSLSSWDEITWSVRRP